MGVLNRSPMRSSPFVVQWLGESTVTIPLSR